MERTPLGRVVDQYRAASGEGTTLNQQAKARQALVDGVMDLMARGEIRLFEQSNAENLRYYGIWDTERRRTEQSIKNLEEIWEVEGITQKPDPEEIIPHVELAVFNYVKQRTTTELVADASKIDRHAQALGQVIEQPSQTAQPRTVLQSIKERQDRERASLPHGLKRHQVETWMSIFLLRERAIETLEAEVEARKATKKEEVVARASIEGAYYVTDAGGQWRAHGRDVEYKGRRARTWTIVHSRASEAIAEADAKEMVLRDNAAWSTLKEKGLDSVADEASNSHNPYHTLEVAERMERYIAEKNVKQIISIVGTHNPTSTKTFETLTGQSLGKCTPPEVQKALHGAFGSEAMMAYEEQERRSREEVKERRALDAHDNLIRRLETKKYNVLSNGQSRGIMTAKGLIDWAMGEGGYTEIVETKQGAIKVIDLVKPGPGESTYTFKSKDEKDYIRYLRDHPPRALDPQEATVESLPPETSKEQDKDEEKIASMAERIATRSETDLRALYEQFRHQPNREHSLAAIGRVFAERGIDPEGPLMEGRSARGTYVYGMKTRPYDLGTCPAEGFMSERTCDRTTEGIYHLIEYEAPLTWPVQHEYGLVPATPEQAGRFSAEQGGYVFLGTEHCYLWSAPEKFTKHPASLGYGYLESMSDLDYGPHAHLVRAGKLLTMKGPDAVKARYATEHDWARATVSGDLLGDLDRAQDDLGTWTSEIRANGDYVGLSEKEKGRYHAHTIAHGWVKHLAREWKTVVPDSMRESLTVWQEVRQTACRQGWESYLTCSDTLIAEHKDAARKRGPDYAQFAGFLEDVQDYRPKKAPIDQKVPEADLKASLVASASLRGIELDPAASVTTMAQAVTNDPSGPMAVRETIAHHEERVERTVAAQNKRDGKDYQKQYDLFGGRDER